MKGGGGRGGGVGGFKFFIYILNYKYLNGTTW